MSAEKNAFELGWRTAAAWVDRDDLLSDIGSPAYLADMQAALNARCTRRDAMTTKDGGPAFPIPIAGCADGSVYNGLEQSSGELGGMSLRDYFAAKAIAGPAVFNDEGFKRTPKEIAGIAYALADAMLAAREQTP